MSTVWAVLDDDTAEVVREELAAGRSRDACGVLLDRAIEVRPLLPDAPGSSVSQEEPS
jgi:hypothetical protein